MPEPGYELAPEEAESSEVKSQGSCRGAEVLQGRGSAELVLSSRLVLGLLGLSVAVGALLGGSAVSLLWPPSMTVAHPGAEGSGGAGVEVLLPSSDSLVGGIEELWGKAPPQVPKELLAIINKFLKTKVDNYANLAQAAKGTQHFHVYAMLGMMLQKKKTVCAGNFTMEGELVTCKYQPVELCGPPYNDPCYLSVLNGKCGGEDWCDGDWITDAESCESQGKMCKWDDQDWFQALPGEPRSDAFWFGTPTDKCTQKENVLDEVCKWETTNETCLKKTECKWGPVAVGGALETIRMHLLNEVTPIVVPLPATTTAAPNVGDGDGDDDRRLSGSGSDSKEWKLYANDYNEKYINGVMGIGSCSPQAGFTQRFFWCRWINHWQGCYYTQGCEWKSSADFETYCTGERPWCMYLNDETTCKGEEMCKWEHCKDETCRKLWPYRHKYESVGLA
ncbi:unnamed protein product [Polarella glacialis]|uniref:Uncharacterized protein n=1 Tax=Polarella glacialis TaxID=89957 RepID=A0A813KXN1_POLGL|nr:unnamed protein product [Polarella glacialis]